MVDAQDLKSCVQLDVWVQVPQFAPLMFVLYISPLKLKNIVSDLVVFICCLLAYISL